MIVPPPTSASKLTPIEALREYERLAERCKECQGAIDRQKAKVDREVATLDRLIAEQKQNVARLSLAKDAVMASLETSPGPRGQA